MCKHTGLGSSAFARHYLRNHYYFLFLSLLRCFSSGGLTFKDKSSTCQVSPFRHLRINVRLQLPVAFRSFPRPSSPSRAKASPVRPYSLPYLYTKYILNPKIQNKSHAFTLHNLNDFSTYFTKITTIVVIYFFSLSMNSFTIDNPIFRFSYCLLLNPFSQS